MRIALAFPLMAFASLLGCKPDTRATENPVRWTVAEISGPLTPGRVATVRLAGAIDGGWYIYSLTQKSGGPTPMTVTVAPTPPFHVQGDILGPKPVIVFDKEFGLETERYQGSPAFDVPVAVASVPSGSPGQLEVKVRFQACNKSFCLPARTVSLPTPVRIARAG